MKSKQLDQHVSKTQLHHFTSGEGRGYGFRVRFQSLGLIGLRFVESRLSVLGQTYLTVEGISNTIEICDDVALRV